MKFCHLETTKPFVATESLVTISMSGGFTNFAGGSVAIEMGGTAAGQFGRITINGAAHSTRSASLRAAAPLRASALRLLLRAPAALAGTLNLSAADAFDPALNSSFNVMTYTSHTGQFDTVNPFDAAQGAGSIGNGKQFAVTYGASGLTVNTVAPSAPAQGTRASPPLTPAPVAPVIKSITKVDDSFHIEFQSIAGRSYRLEWTDDLIAGKWTVLTEGVAGTGKMIKVIDAGAGTQKQCFYRVVETQTAAMKKP